MTCKVSKSITASDMLKWLPY